MQVKGEICSGCRYKTGGVVHRLAEGDACNFEERRTENDVCNT